MRTRTRTAVVAVAALVALALAAVATAAYTSPKLSVAYAPGNVTHIVASASVNDDATAVAAIVIPNGSAITTTAAPGTKVGTAKAQVSALALGGALLPLAGDILIAPPGAVNAGVADAAARGAVTPQVTFLLVLQAAGQTINAAGVHPADEWRPDGARLDPARVLPAAARPSRPRGRDVRGEVPERRPDAERRHRPGRAGRLGRVLDAVERRRRHRQHGRAVVSPAAIAPGGITLSGRKVKGVKRLAGRVTQGGAGVATRVTILAGAKRLATVAAKANGTFSYAVPKKSKATTFRARAVVAGRAAPAACTPFASLGVPCVNPTASGFTATSGSVRLR